jgi:hypothetical protein
VGVVVVKLLVEQNGGTLTVDSGRVADSYFLVSDENGAVLASTPAITRQY